MPDAVWKVNGDHPERDPLDFYETPRSFVTALLNSESFGPKIWDPGAGKGAIGDSLMRKGYEVLETDIFPQHERIQTEDFLSAARTGYDIIANPPFKHMNAFAKKAWELCDRKFAFVMPLEGLVGVSRQVEIWSKMKPSKVIISWRRQHIMSARGLIISQFSHIWAVFDKQHEGPTKVEWTPDVTYKHSDLC